MTDIGGTDFEPGQKVVVKMLNGKNWHPGTISRIGPDSRSGQVTAFVDNGLTFKAWDVQNGYVRVVR